eukprot:GGOE01057929.1.p1 GENE.GGOE01057929.1~~GGOE01057929.1.p1  ORF type:complete len:485 (-),score=98.84 GGOE01057929.1:293-1747(-)
MSFLPMLQGSHRSRATVLTDSQLQAITESLPVRCRDADRWKLCYSTLEHGVSMNTFYHNVAGYENVVLIIMTDRGAVLGAFSPEPLHVEAGRHYYGSRGTFLFHFSAAGFRSYRWARNNDYFVYCTHDCIGFGGGSNFGILVEASLSSGSTGSCDTFDAPALVPLRNDDTTATFVIYALEVWHVPEFSGTLLHFDSPATPTSSKARGDRTFKELKVAKAARKLALRKVLDWLIIAARLPALTRILTAFVAIAVSLVAYSRVRVPHPPSSRLLTPSTLVNLSHHLRSGTAFKQTTVKATPHLSNANDDPEEAEAEAHTAEDAPVHHAVGTVAEVPPATENTTTRLVPRPIEQAHRAPMKAQAHAVQPDPPDVAGARGDGPHGHDIPTNGPKLAPASELNQQSKTATVVPHVATAAELLQETRLQAGTVQAVVGKKAADVDQVVHKPHSTVNHPATHLTADVLLQPSRTTHKNADTLGTATDHPTQ